MSAPVAPQGATLLSTFKRSFADVPIDAENDNAISTTEFLEAAEALTTMFGTPQPRPSQASGPFPFPRRTFSSLIRPSQTLSDPLPSRLSRVTCWEMSRCAHARAYAHIPITLPPCTCQARCSWPGSLAPTGYIALSSRNIANLKLENPRAPASCPGRFRNAPGPRSQ